MLKKVIDSNRISEIIICVDDIDKSMVSFNGYYFSTDINIYVVTACLLLNFI